VNEELTLTEAAEIGNMDACCGCELESSCVTIELNKGYAAREFWGYRAYK
jgi:hypothetical protein